MDWDALHAEAIEMDAVETAKAEMIGREFLPIISQLGALTTRVVTDVERMDHGPIKVSYNVCRPSTGDVLYASTSYLHSFHAYHISA